MSNNSASSTLAPSKAFSIEHVRSVRHWNEHLFSFSVNRPPSFRFRSGEFVMIGLPEDGKPLLRAYSIASPAYADELEFLSIKVADGRLTSRLQKIVPGDEVLLGAKPTGTLVADALKPGSRLFLLSTGTGLAPFLSIIRDPDIYDRFSSIILVHSVRRVSDLAYHSVLETQLADDPLVQDQALAQLTYIPTVTREDYHTMGRIDKLIDNGRIFRTAITGPEQFDPENDRVMLCGSMDMIKGIGAKLEGLGFTEGSNSRPGDYVIERAFAE